MAKANKKTRDEDLEHQKDEFRRESLEVFKKPDLLRYIREELDKDHINDDREKLFVFCSELSSQLPPDYRFSTALTGYTSEGKTNLWKTTSKHLPGKWYLDLTRATKATLEDDITDVHLIYFGEEGANKDVIETVKQLVEDGVHALKKDARNDFKTARKEDQPRKVGIYSTTKDASDEELATRYAIVCISGDPAKYKRVNENTLRVASDLVLEMRRRDKARTWISVGLEQLQHVDVITIPYAHLMQVDNRRARSMRDLKRFLSLIRVLAWLHQQNRVVIEHDGKRVLYAAPADYWNAREIGDDIFAQSLSGVEHRLQKVIDAYEKIRKDRDKSKILNPYKDGKPDPQFDETLIWVDRSLLQDALGIAKRDTIKTHVKSLESMGLFTSVWTGNRCFVAMKKKSATNQATKHRLITDQRTEIYPLIVKAYNEKMVGELVGQKVAFSPGDLSLLTLDQKTTGEPTSDQKPRKKAIKHVKKHKKGRSKMVGDYRPGDVKQFILANGDDDKTISYERLREAFPDRLITGLIESQLLKVQQNGNYRYMEVIAGDEHD